MTCYWNIHIYIHIYWIVHTTLNVLISYIIYMILMLFYVLNYISYHSIFLPTLNEFYSLQSPYSCNLNLPKTLHSGKRIFIFSYDTGADKCPSHMHKPWEAKEHQSTISSYNSYSFYIMLYFMKKNTTTLNILEVDISNRTADLG